MMNNPPPNGTHERLDPIQETSNRNQIAKAANYILQLSQSH